MNRATSVSEEQRRYGKVLSYASVMALAVVLITFFVYISGTLSPLVPIDEMSRYWHLRAADYIRETGLPTGWGWIGLLRHGDSVNFGGIALLSSLTILCLLVILPVLFRKKDALYIAIALLQIMILILAASGILTR